jgi:hypothetical protein
MNNIAEPIAAVPNTRRWLHPTPGRLLVVLLAVELALLVSRPWFPKGWAVLFAVAAVGVFLLFMLLWLAFALLLRRRFQFSIRSLLLLTVAVAVPCSWMAVEMKWAREQRKAVEPIKKMGWSVSYGIPFNASEYPLALVWIREQLGDDFFGIVAVVNLSSTQVTDAGLENLKGFTELQTLSLFNTKVTDAGLENLKGLGQLQELYVGDTKITDIGLNYIKSLPLLHDLGLDHTQITDSGLEGLKGLTQLERLDICNTKVTDAGVAELQKALPNCKIRH